MISTRIRDLLNKLRRRKRSNNSKTSPQHNRLRSGNCASSSKCTTVLFCCKITYHGIVRESQIGRRLGDGRKSFASTDTEMEFLNEGGLVMGGCGGVGFVRHKSKLPHEKRARARLPASNFVSGTRVWFRLN
ncbi:hypothetical protein CDAR_256461 [Caerostris darwini]|uniref:Uncharacterized protein n=1 Tax=Caerostris darwini TaxID=1538125 RepID=A0AAV4SGK8_9ARAC|nr:hypothetical protein CDAR_256461 [Caerostris darwini]